MAQTSAAGHRRDTARKPRGSQQRRARRADSAARAPRGVVEQPGKPSAALTLSAHLQGVPPVLGAALPLQIILGTEVSGLQFDPYVNFLNRSFDTLAPRECGETPLAYIDRQLLAYGQQWRWNATVMVFERRELEQSPQNHWCSITPTPEPVQVIGVMDDDGTYFDISETVDTLKYWCPRLAGSLLTTFQNASHILQIWGPVEAVENLVAFYDERDYWDNIRDEALEHYKALQKEEAKTQAAGGGPDAPPPAEAPPITTITRAQFKTYLREQDVRTPGKLKREVGQVTYNAAKYPLTREQLGALAADPVTSAVQAQALQEFLARCDEIADLHRELMTLSDEEAYASIQPEDEYLHYQFSLETQRRREDDRIGAVYEMLREYMDYQYNGGGSPSFLYAAQTTLGDELPVILGMLQRLHDLFTAQCRLLADWPETGITREMRRAHGRLKPPKCRTR